MESHDSEAPADRLRDEPVTFAGAGLHSAFDIARETLLNRYAAEVAAELLPGAITVTPGLPADGWPDVDQAAALAGQVTRLGTRFADADGPGQVLVLVTLPDGRQVIGAAALHLFVPAARYIGRGGFAPASSFDWSRYERTCDPDRQLDGTGDLCLFLGGSWGDTPGARSFIGDVLALADRATGNPERLNALALAFPRELTAWRVWRTWPGPTPTAAELYAELTREQPR